MTLGPEQGFRCSTLSRQRGESQEGTASTVRSFLLVECAGPWGTEALRDGRLPEPVKRRLQTLERDTSVRPLLVRRPGRPGRTTEGPTRVFAAYAGGEGTWLQSMLLDGPADLLDVDPAPLGRGHRPGWRDIEGPLFAVCTHGRHDACCAERGRPVVAALAALAPESTWEVSHIGGDRFAANVLVLPDGLYYGRVEPDDAAALVAAQTEGRLDLEHLRGRTAYPFAAQAAELHLRRHLGEDRLAAVRLLGSSRTGGRTAATFAVGARRWSVTVATSTGAPCQLTCRATVEGTPPTHELVELTEIGRPPPDLDPQP
ncbi:MAG: hypothetical protein QOK15_3431 [Nocardioidaceae bacterium]|nr:hypothetical protein [Nocardioidaceae bacterium]